MSDDTLLRARWRQVFDRAERNMQERMTVVREGFPVRFSGGNIKLLIREGGNCLDDFFDGAWADTEGRGSAHAASAARNFAKSIDNNIMAYVAAHLRNGPKDRIWQAAVEAVAILAERVELAIEDARSGKEVRCRAATSGNVGRRPGVGGYHRQDAKMVKRIRTMIEAGEANSAWDATLALVDEIPGGGADDSRRKRVASLYNRTFAAND